MPVSSRTSSPGPRAPSFLGDVRGTVSRATFGGATAPAAIARVMPFVERAGGPGAGGDVARRAFGVEDPSGATEPPPGMEPLAPPLPPPPPQPGPEFVERLAQAVGELRRASEQIAEQASADALEMAIA